MSVMFLLMWISSMSHVDFVKSPCRPFDFKGQGSHPSLPLDRPTSSSPIDQPEQLSKGSDDRTSRPVGKRPRLPSNHYETNYNHKCLY